MENEKIALSWKIELLSILGTTVLAVLILLPILRNVPEYQFFIYNSVIIFVFFMLTRYIFLLKFTPFARFAPLKAIFIFATIPLLVYLIDGLAEFQFFLDEEGANSIVLHLPASKQMSISNYIRSEMVFFGVGAIITSFIFPIRMIISIWKVRNRNTV
jgi:hypothetical protein